MPTILCVLLLVLPIVAALALDTAAFASFLLLFCVAGALTISTSDDRVSFDDCADDRRRHRKSRLGLPKGEPVRVTKAL
jgi:hypothetical protein